MVTENLIETDVLVIGGGMSGIFAAVKAREEGVKVTLVEKAYVGRSGAAIWADTFSVFNPEWGHKINEWMSQIASVSDYTNNPEWTEVSLKESYDRYKELVSWGFKFQKGKDNEPFRIAGGALETCIHGHGWEELPLLRKQTLKSGVEVIDRIMITDLMKQDGRVIGAVGFHTGSGDFYIFKAKATILCTGCGTLGISSHFEKSFTYDGETMAYRAGAEISGKEFPGLLTPVTSGDEHYTATGGNDKISLKDRDIKIAPEVWHPTYGPGKFVDSEGNIVNWVTMAASVASGKAPIFYDLDAARPEEIMFRMQINKNQEIDNIGESLIDLSQKGLYSGTSRFEWAIGFAVLGGGSGICTTGTNGGTNLPGLYAAGDCYHSGASGAVYPFIGFGTRNAAVTGARAGRNAAEYASKSGKISINQEAVTKLKNSVYAPLERAGGFDADWVTMQLKTFMTPFYVSIVREGNRLKGVLSLIEYINNKIVPMMYSKPKDAHGLRFVHEARGRVLNTEMMLRSALFRTESRGSHYREDFPQRDDANWLAQVKVSERKGKMELIKEPFPEKWHPDLSLPYRERYPRRFLGEQ